MPKHNVLHISYIFIVLVVAAALIPSIVSALPGAPVPFLQNTTGSIPDVVLALDKSIGDSTVEYSIILTVDSGNVTNASVVNVGTDKTVLWNLTAIFDVAKPNSTIVNVHNHPNGICRPSDGDITAWEWLKGRVAEHGITVAGNVVLCGKIKTVVLYKTP